MEDYDKFLKEIHSATNRIKLNKAFKTTRRGMSSLRDRLVFTKMLWTEAMTYLAIVQTIVIFTALIPQSVDSINGALSYLHIPIQFPKEVTSVLAVIFIISVFVFGFFAMRIAGTNKRQQEIATLIHPAFFLLWKKIEDIEKEIKSERRDSK